MRFRCFSVFLVRVHKMSKIKCCVCLIEKPTILPCECTDGHICLSCFHQIRDNKCPICRREYVSLDFIVGQFAAFLGAFVFFSQHSPFVMAVGIIAFTYYSPAPVVFLIGTFLLLEYIPVIVKLSCSLFPLLHAIVLVLRRNNRKYSYVLLSIAND